jgi:hypothetical protein
VDKFAFGMRRLEADLVEDRLREVWERTAARDLEGRYKRFFGSL